MRKYYLMLLLSSFSLLSGCILFTPTISVAVPDGYLGWCYIIPVKDTTGFVFNKVRGDVYGIDKDGILYVPEAIMEEERDVRVDIYDGNKMISEDTRYAGHVFTNNSYNNERHHYIHFFIPKKEERSIKHWEEYWRSASYRGEGNRRYDSLVKAKRIIFR